MKKILCVALCAMTSVSMLNPVYAKAPEIKNVIYMIPDGGGMEPFYLANDLKKAGGWDRSIYPNSTVTEKEEMYAKQYLVGAVKTYSADASVTDSAAAGTALSSGYKTKNGYIGVTPEKVPRANILEAAQSVGKNVGIVSTYEWTNATPASFSAHDTDRGNYAPMSQQIVNQDIDVVLGGGFGAAKWGDIGEAEIRGYDIINTREDLEAIKPGDKIWGNLVSGAFPYDIEYTAETPNLAQMTKAAITALNDGDEEGFFLMVEGSKVDGGGHSNSVTGMMSEFLAFDEACKVALQFAEGRKDTIVVIVPDHDTGGMVLPKDTAKAVESLVAGEEPTDITWETTGHTARNGGLFMYVPKDASYPKGISGVKYKGSSNAYRKYVIENTAIAPYLAGIMGIDLTELSEELFVDVTDMGTYNADYGLFCFDKYPITARSNVSYACVNNDIVDLEGQVTVYINGKFYVPKLLLDIAEGKAEYDICNYVSPVESSMTTYMNDTTNIDNWNGRVAITNVLPEAEFSGKIKFTYPDSFAKMDPIEVKVDAKSSKTFEFECPEFNSRNMDLVFKYDIISDDGKTYSFSSKFKGLAYAGYANGEIKIDGVIDEEVWENGIVMTCDDASKIVMIEDWKGDRDLSADFSMLWDENYFYMYSVVTDEIFHTVESPGELWRGDSVQFGIYHDTTGAMINGTAGKNFEEIGISYMDGKPVGYRFVSKDGTTKTGEIQHGEGFELACTRVGDDLIYELKFKWSELLGYEYSPVKGDVLGFSALINDNDGSGRRGWMEYGSGIGMYKDVNEFVMMPFLDFNDGSQEYKLFVNDSKVEGNASPVVIDGINYLPVRRVFEALGAQIGWNSETSSVIAKIGENEAVMQTDKNEVTMNGDTKEFDAPMKNIDGNTYVSVQVVENVGVCDVDWDDGLKIIQIKK